MERSYDAGDPELGCAAAHNLLALIPRAVDADPRVAALTAGLDAASAGVVEGSCR